MLTSEERESLVKYRIEKAGETLAEARDCATMGDYDDFVEWHQEEVEPLFEKVENYINRIKSLVGF